MHAIHQAVAHRARRNHGLGEAPLVQDEDEQDDEAGADQAEHEGVEDAP